MKKAAGIGLVILFFLGLLILLLVKLLSGSSSTAATTPPASLPVASTGQKLPVNSTPEEVARTCYSWYIRYFASTREWTYEQVASNSTIRQCFSSSFIESWKDAFAVSETDPVLISPDYYYSWLNSISVRTVSQTADSNNVEVTLGTGNQKQVLGVELLPVNNGWQIASVSLLQSPAGD